MYRFSDVLISAPALIKNDRIKHKCTDFYMVLHLKHLLSTYVFTVRCLCMGMEGGGYMQAYRVPHFELSVSYCRASTQLLRALWRSACT